jgi:Mn-dependent DtxR family transcriptional regulator
LPKQVVDSSSAREVISDLRNEGYVEERERGVIRFTRRGYELLRERFDPAGDDSRILLAV